MRVPFIVYANFESFKLQLSTCQTNPEKSYTNKFQKHGGFCYHIKCFDNNQLLFLKEFNDDDVVQIFMNTLEKNIKDIFFKFKFPKNMIMTRHDKLVYDNFINCHICNEELGGDRVRDHCHLSGKFRGAAHEVCNVNTRFQRFSQLYFTICLATIVIYLLKH